MKRLRIFPILFIFFTINIQGQSDKPFRFGCFFTGGSLSIDKKNIESTSAPFGSILKRDEINISTDLRLGLFLSNSVAGGLMADYTLFRSISESEEKSDYSFFLFKPFVRIYAPPGIYGEAAYGFGFQRLGPSGFSPVEDRDINSWNLGLGYCILVQNIIGIEPSIKYEVLNHYRNDNDTTEKFRGFRLDLTVLIYIDYLDKIKKR